MCLRNFVQTGNMSCEYCLLYLNISSQPLTSIIIYHNAHQVQQLTFVFLYKGMHSILIKHVDSKKQ